MEEEETNTGEVCCAICGATGENIHHNCCNMYFKQRIDELQDTVNSLVKASNLL